jgi:hypothetical protein
MKRKQVYGKALQRQLKPYMNSSYSIQFPGHPRLYAMLTGIEGKKIKVDILDQNKIKIQQVSLSGTSGVFGGPGGDVSAWVGSFLFGVFVIIALSFWFGFCGWMTMINK